MFAMTRLDFVTLFPDMVLGALGHSIAKRAAESGACAYRAANPRDFVFDRHRTVDDRPIGGGPGMVMMAPPVADALASLDPDPNAAVVLTDPTGYPFRQEHARELAARPQVVFLCGHYEGMDHRVETELATHVFSIGDFVMTGGEIAALAMADAVVRLLPGVLGSPDSLSIDSHGDGLLSAPQYTRPREWRGIAVPEVLRSGDHAAVARWKRREALRLTRERRPDLFARASLDKRDVDMLSF
ncbi:MAG: tRNA (guanosine(37)-N1)-methyltransferase TrmD [Fimbriimonadaceae bacterium]